jgi:hypothetical protein
MNELFGLVNNFVQNLVGKLSTKYKIPENQLIADILESFRDGNNNPVPHLLIPKQQPPLSNKRYCQYVYTKGTKTGESCKNVIASSINIYCSRHSIKEDAKVEKGLTNEKQKIILKLNRLLNLWWHPVSKLVVKSPDEKNVCIGIFKNDKLEKLNKDDVELCKQLGFKLENHNIEEEEVTVEDSPNKKRKLNTDDFMVINKTAKNVEEIINDMFGL